MSWPGEEGDGLMPARFGRMEPRERARPPSTRGERDVRRVLVSYESSPRGRAALMHAIGLAGGYGADLIVASVATHERVDVGCARCRSSASLWNREMLAMAEESLAEAAGLVGPSPAVEYRVAIGSPARAIAQAADESGADVIVIPWEKTGRLRRLLSPPVAEHLRDAGPWEIVVAPAGAPETAETRGRTPVPTTSEEP
jgi:nucleotide-binding universal stress UspA family protein